MRNKKMVTYLIGVLMTASMMNTAYGVEAAEPVQETAVTEPAGRFALAEPVGEDDLGVDLFSIMEETEEMIDPFVEGSALLSDYGYDAGELTDEGWTSKFLEMKYTPADGVEMGIEQNDQIQKYHLRNGVEKQVALNAMIALSKNGCYAQLMVEVNPNHEKAEDMIERFKENEELELSTEVKETIIAGKKFLTTTGIREHEKYMLAVSTDKEDFVIAMIVKYDVAAMRKTLLGGFAEYKTGEESEETEALSDADDDAVSLSLPEEFENAEVMPEADSEAEED